MTQVFADASYWIALLSPRDELHRKAIAAFQRFSASKTVTSEMVLVEVLNALSDADAHLRRAAAEVIQGLRVNPHVTVIPQTAEQFESALQQYRQAADKSWSVTDCAGFQIMHAMRIASALTYDKHFVQAGYEALLR